MRATPNDHAQACVREGGAESSPLLPSAVALGPRTQQELQYELEAAIGFADYCCYLAGAGLDARVEEFVAMAEALYEETMCTVLNRGGTRGVADAS
jgi:hypothetical protein